MLPEQLEIQQEHCNDGTGLGVDFALCGKEICVYETTFKDDLCCCIAQFTNETSKIAAAVITR